jgi:hypothetical protein
MGILSFSLILCILPPKPANRATKKENPFPSSPSLSLIKTCRFSDASPAHGTRLATAKKSGAKEKAPEAKEEIHFFCSAFQQIHGTSPPDDKLWYLL